MASQLQYPKDSHDAEDLDDPTGLLKVGSRFGLQSERHVERHDGEDVDEVEHSLDEL